MSENQEMSPFVVPKLCIKRVPVQQGSPKKQPVVETAQTSDAGPSNRLEPISGGGGLKLVLRVPKDYEPPTSDSTMDTSEENTLDADDAQSSERDSEASKDGQSVENESVKLSSFLRSNIGGSVGPILELCGPESTPSSPLAVMDEEAEDPATSPKRRRRRKRFRLSMPAQKTKTKSSKPDGSESAVSETPTSSQRPKRTEQKKKDTKKEDSPAEETVGSVEIPGLPSAPVNDEPEIRVPSPPPQILAFFSPLQLLLDHLLRGFLKKDPENYFAFPVTEDIAPNYSSIISKPMDFSTIRNKIDVGEYQDLRQFKEDIDLIASNAMTYNQKNTIYYMAAKKLQNVAEYMFSREKMNAARKLIPQLSKLTPEEICISSAELDQRAEAKKAKLGYYSCIVDDMSPEEIVEQARSAAEAARKKLKLKRPNIQVVYANGEGKLPRTTTLNMLMPEHLHEKGENEDASDKKGRPVVLGDLIPKLKEGNPGLLMPNENKDFVVPVTYLDNGAFSSFAPFYDSTWATLNKDESDLLLATFGGDEQCVRYVDSLRTFVSGTDDRVAAIVESVVDEIVKGRSSPVAEAEKVQDQSMETTSDVAFAALNSLIPEDDIVFADSTDLGQQPDRNPTQAALDQNAILLQELFNLQNQRLSAQPAFVLTHVQGPSDVEVETATRVVGNIQELAAQTTPAQLVPMESIRELTQEARVDDANNGMDEYDMDILREFLVVDNE